MSKRRILLTSTHSATFVLHDLALLRRQFEVEHFVTTGASLPGMLSRVARADLTFTWFASVYSFFVVSAARLLRKPSIIVVGGADLVSLPAIGYGLRRSPWKRWLVRRALRMATRVLAVDPSLIDETVRFIGDGRAKIAWVPTGYDAEFWTPAGDKDPIVLTVASCENENRMKVKGIDFLFDVARAMDNVRFVLVGIRDPLLTMLRTQCPSNMQIIPFGDQSLVRTHYRRAKVYCQPSRSEGLPNSICEAMLCECVPVGTNVGGMATAMGGHGFTVRFGDLPGMVDALHRALATPISQGEEARRHIAQEFPIARREEELVRILSELLI